MNTFSDPINIINQVSFSDTAHVADFGCGAGAYSIACAKKIPLGKVFAIDVRKDMIERLANLTESEQLSNLHVVWGDVDEPQGSRLRDASVDLVFITNTLFQVENRGTMIQEAARILKYEGQLVLVDWSESFGNIGPKPDHVIEEHTAKLLLEENGFLVDQTLQAGEHHYGFIARKI